MSTKTYPLCIGDLLNVPKHVRSTQGWGNKIRAIATPEKRAPKKGEWFLSGAIPHAYYAPNDLTGEYRIMKLVLVERVEQIIEVL